MLTVGEILRNTREKKEIDLSEVEKNIRVREKYLRAIEENNWSYFTSKIYIAGIIKNYSNFLGLDTAKMLAFFRRDYERKEDIRFKKKLSDRYLTSQTRKLITVAVIAVFVFFLGYFGYQLKLYFVPPNVRILEPKINKFRGDKKIRIVGKTDRETVVNIFGERVFTNKEGIFEYDFPLSVGKNELEIEVVGASGRKRIIKKIFFRER
jgi:transcriptional regulator with XRE-family HTH domain